MPYIDSGGSEFWGITALLAGGSVIQFNIGRDCSGDSAGNFLQCACLWQAFPILEIPPMEMFKIGVKRIL